MPILLFYKMEKNNYESPKIVMLTIVVEKGYQASGNKNEDGGISAPSWG